MLWRKRKARLRGIGSPGNKGTGQDAVLNRVLRGKLVEKGTFEQRLEGEEEGVNDCQMNLIFTM